MRVGFDRRDVRMATNLFRMMLRDRYLGSRLGLLWAVGSPALMFATFTFVFGFVLKARLPGAETSLAYVSWLISGYGPWLATSEGLATSTVSVSGNAGLIKNLPLKSELLSIAGALTGIVPLGMAIVFEFVLLAVRGSGPSWAWLALPFVTLVQFLLIAGMGLYLSAANVLIRDVALALPNAMLVLLFATPIFYSVSDLPRAMQMISEANPFYRISDAYRVLLVKGEMPGIVASGYSAALSLVVFGSGLSFFRRMRTHFDSHL